MRLFTRVADTRSFSAAADQLQLPRSTVSSEIKALEQRLGTRLLNRTTRSVSLTADGQTYRQRCEQLLAELEENDQQFRQAPSELRGTIRVDIPARIARTHVIPALPGFFEKHPAIDLVLGVSDRPVDLIQEAVDCAIRVGPLNDSRLIARRLGLLAVGSYASPDYLARFGTPRHPRDLARHRMVAYASPLTGKAYRWEYRQNGRTREMAVPHALTVNNAEAYTTAAVAGLGLIQVPAYDVEALITDGLLVEVLPASRPAPLPISAVYPDRRQRSRRVSAFVAWFERVFAAPLGRH